MSNRLSEERIIQIFNKIMPKNRILPDDDVSGFITNISNIFISSDMFVQSTDMPSTMSLAQASRKSIIMSVSDFASKGIIPKYCNISIGIPKSYSIKDIKELVKGFDTVLKEYKISLIGGDTNSSTELIIDCTLIGFSNYKIPKRNNACDKDIVYCLGKFGLTGAGLYLLLKKIKPSNNFEKQAIKSVLYPKVELNTFNILVKNNLINSSIDSSDGLCSSLYKIAKLSSVSIQIDTLPFNFKLKNFSDKYNRCINDLNLYSGEEYNIIFTVKSSNIKKCDKLLLKNNIDFTKIGYVNSGKPSVFYKNKLLKNHGWDGFLK